LFLEEHYFSTLGGESMKKKTFISTAVLLASPAVLAHAGHDHSAWTASLIHTVAALSLAGVAFIAYKVLTNKKTTQQKIEK